MFPYGDNDTLSIHFEFDLENLISFNDVAASLDDIKLTNSDFILNSSDKRVNQFGYLIEDNLSP